jgi:hypothetical protein
MTWVAVAVAGGTIVGGLLSSNAQQNAANTAAGAQTQAAQLGIAEQQRQFDAIQKLLAPYVTAGTGALTAQQSLLGLRGAPAQQAAISGIQNGPQFQAMLQQGQNSILQNASATGGLRGGNTQAALGQFSPMLLSGLIQQQLGNYGGLVGIGQNAAAGTGNAGMQTGNNITALLGQQGSAQAGAALAAGQAQQNLYGSIGNGIGLFAGMGGFRGLGGGAVQGQGPYSGLGYENGSDIGAYFSDARLKRDVTRLGVAANGLPVYAFRYAWRNELQIGHMANEVRERFPDAVSVHPSGFLMVDYSKV